MLVSRSTGRHMLVRTISLLSGALLMAPVVALAANDTPIMISNLSPLAALRGLPPASCRYAAGFGCHGVAVAFEPVYR